MDTSDCLLLLLGKYGALACVIAGYFGGRRHLRAALLRNAINSLASAALVEISASQAVRMVLLVWRNLHLVVLQ
jgi:hypothetical protein